MVDLDFDESLTPFITKNNIEAWKDRKDKLLWI